jgi:homoserine dehydrogenase
MPHHNLALLGFGNVGRSFVRLLERKKAELKKQHGITYTVVGIATARHGAAIDPGGLESVTAADLVEAGDSLEVLTKVPIRDNFDFLLRCGADVLFENTPVNIETGQPAIDHLRAALERGMHVITANKGPVVHAFKELNQLAESVSRKFYFESTVMDGAPIFSLFRSGLPTTHLLSFKGILNSTTNLVLTRMEGGESFEEAVKYTQQVGLAESDPSADIDGWDSAVKVAALVTVLMGIPLKPQQVERTGIREITAEMVKIAKADGMRWKLVCSAVLKGENVKAHVGPELVASFSPFFSVEGSTSVVEFHTDTLSSLSIVEGNPGPDTTAYGLLADFINAVG